MYLLRLHYLQSTILNVLLPEINLQSRIVKTVFHQMLFCLERVKEWRTLQNSYLYLQILPTDSSDMYRISVYSFRGNQFFFGLKIGKLFKGGNYSRQESSFLTRSFLDSFRSIFACTIVLVIILYMSQQARMDWNKKSVPQKKTTGR